jgi:hypothetical protein
LKELERAAGWPAGVYLFGDSVLRVGLVAASQLPRERSTILVRLICQRCRDRCWCRSREPLTDSRPS